MSKSSENRILLREAETEIARCSKINERKDFIWENCKRFHTDSLSGDILVKNIPLVNESFGILKGTVVIFVEKNIFLLLDKYFKSN
jgi:hypothetical protein